MSCVVEDGEHPQTTMSFLPESSGTVAGGCEEGKSCAILRMGPGRQTCLCRIERKEALFH